MDLIFAALGGRFCRWLRGAVAGIPYTSGRPPEPASLVAQATLFPTTGGAATTTWDLGAAVVAGLSSTQTLITSPNRATPNNVVASRIMRTYLANKSLFAPADVYGA